MHDSKRFALTIQYDGRPFRGWQLQPEGTTIQGEIEGVLLRLTGTPVRIIGAGRTDRGVHALGQVAALTLPPAWSALRLRRALNALLPEGIWVQEVRQVLSDFHPRYDAIWRGYQYHLDSGPLAASPFRRGLCWDVSREPPDFDLLQAIAGLIPGERSFRKFAKSGQPERGERCRVEAAEWRQEGETFLLSIRADRYLHHMVRYLVGTMVAVARGERPLEEWSELLHNPESSLTTSPPAPPEGLFLAQVGYPAGRLGPNIDRDPPTLEMLGE